MLTFPRFNFVSALKVRSSFNINTENYFVGVLSGRTFTLNYTILSFYHITVNANFICKPLFRFNTRVNPG